MLPNAVDAITYRPSVHRCSLLSLALLAYHVRLNLRIGNRKPYPMVTISVLNLTNGMMVLYLFHTSPPIYPFLIRGYLHAYVISNESYGKVYVNDLGNLIFREISTPTFFIQHLNSHVLQNRVGALLMTFH